MPGIVGGESAATISRTNSIPEPGHFKLPEKKDGDYYNGLIQYTKEDRDQILKMDDFYKATRNGEIDRIVEILLILLPDSSAIAMKNLAKLCVDRSTAEPTKEALLSAICIGSRPLVELILQLFCDFPNEEQNGCTNSSMFAPHITPLILACINNNFAIVETLLLRGHSIAFPHHSTCGCAECAYVTNSNVEHVRKIDVYRAVSSEAFLWLATTDPFAAASALSTDIETAMDDDNVEFIDVYNQLHLNVQHFALRLIEQCWKVEEVDLFLSQRAQSLISNCSMEYPRLRMALDSSLKNFVASVPVQRAAAALWWKGWGNFGSNTGRDAFRILRHVIMYPILALLFIFTRGAIGKSFKVPLARYISFTASYALFLGSLIGIRILKKSSAVYDRDMTGPYWQLTMEMYIYVYAVGLILERYLELSRRGLAGYFALWWRWFDFVFLGVFMLAMHIWISALFIGVHETDLMKKIHRRHWPNTDYFLWYDVFLSTGCILAFWKSFYFFQLIKGVGATIISIGRCVSQIYSYIFVMGIIMFSFGIGLNMLSNPYISIKAKAWDGEIKTSSDFFDSIPTAVRRLYWAFYGYMEMNTSPMVVGNAGPNQNMTNNDIVNGAMEGMNMAYHAILIITLLNLMISLLVKKADEVLDNEDLEFKYTRACIYSEFYEDSISVPPPFNLFFVIINFVFTKSFSKEYKLHWPDFFVKRELLDPTEEALEQERIVYENLLSVMFHRFRSCNECAYSCVFRSALEKDKSEAKSPKMIFMNDTNLVLRSNLHHE